MFYCVYLIAVSVEVALYTYRSMYVCICVCVSVCVSAWCLTYKYFNNIWSAPRLDLDSGLDCKWKCTFHCVRVSSALALQYLNTSILPTLPTIRQCQRIQWPELSTNATCHIWITKSKANQTKPKTQMQGNVSEVHTTGLNVKTWYCILKKWIY